MTFDTYEREVERFGGPEGMDLAERVFHADSIAVLRLLSNEADGLDPDARLAHAVLGVDRLLQDFVVPVRARLGLITGMIKRAADREIEGSWEREAGERFRTGRQLLEAGSAAYRDRSRALRPIALRIRSIHASDGQSGGPEKLLADLAHLHCNRMLRSAATGEEAIVLRWLAKLYRSRVARRSKNP
jgi:thiopeptide-type bacteriocin biosynthesis protein